ncbi:MAG TPA: ACP phosphodiesterase [Chitinophagaceae bacterium]|nr:ACP phosphodiesterase [Chitinophagaceae bacterium]
MNYLAHAYLSFGIPGIVVGNLISDFVKGKKKFDYPVRIQQGISLHRAIDTFTDEHEVTKLAKEIFRPAYRLYSGAFVDVVFDHFLAIDNHEFTQDSLLSFSQSVYTILDNHQTWLPHNFSLLFPYMKSQNWLYNYRNIQGTKNSFGGVVRRAAYLAESETAGRLFEQHYEELGTLYQQFFPSLKIFARQRLDMLLSS